MSEKGEPMEIVNQPIETLPDEMLIEIFKVMDGETLKESTVVHKKWNELIGENPFTMKPLKRVLKRDWSQRNFWINIRSVIIIDQDAARVMSYHTEQRQLEFKECFLSIRNSDFLTYIFNNLNKLQVLKFILANCYDSQKFSIIKGVQMPSLKTVVLYRSSLIFLAFLKHCELKTLKICDIEMMSDLPDFIVEFLKTQKKIEELALRDLEWKHSTVIDNLINDINFPLKKLALHRQTDFLGEEANALKFLEKFVNTLEELALGSFFPGSVYEIIFEKFKNLKILDVYLTYAPKEDTFYHNLRPNVAVKKLVIRGLTSQNEFKLQGFIVNLPNVESLVLMDPSISKEMVLFISHNLLNLEEIKMKTLEVASFKEVILTSIKSLRIRSLMRVSRNDWYTICRSLPNIQRFAVENVFQMSSLSEPMFLIFTQGWKYLTSIDLGFGFEPRRRMFTLLLQNSKNLKTVSIPAVIRERNVQLADLIHKCFEQVQGPRLFFKSSKQQPREQVELWNNEDCWDDVDDEHEDDGDSDIDDLYEDNLDVEDDSD